MDGCVEDNGNKIFYRKKKRPAVRLAPSLVLSRYLKQLHRAHFINPVSKRLR